MSLFNRSAKFFSSFNNQGERPPFEAAYVYLLALITGFFIADLSTLYVRPSMLPANAPPSRPVRSSGPHYIDISQYAPITTSGSNIFNRDQKIPPPVTADGQQGPGSADDAIPILSQLPLKLEGTLVHSNPKKSVATVSSKSRNEAKAFSVDNDIDGLARVMRIERRKVIFRNLNNQRVEYIEIPKDGAVSFGVKDPVISSDEVQHKGNFEFSIARSDLSKYLGNLSAVLQQAAMVPNIVPGSGGKVEGFRFVSIQPGSIFEKLGFKPSDVVKAVNGEPINSPTKGMEAFNQLKGERSIRMTVNRDGKDEQFSYDINE